MSLGNNDFQCRNGDKPTVKYIPKDVSGGLTQQVIAELRREPGQVLSYLWKTAIGSARFLAEAPLTNGILFYKFMRIFFTIEGGVSLLEILKLTSLIKRHAKNGILVEVGTWKGLSACCLSHVAALKKMKLWIVDTFTGLPQSGGPFHVSEGRRRGYHFEEGSYAGSYETVSENLRRLGYANNVSMVAGNVIDMPPLEFPDGQKISLAFIDVDLPESYRGAFKALARGIDKGTILVLHEGLIDDVREIATDNAFWKTLSLPPPRLVIYEHSWRMRTLMTGLIFDD